MLTFCFHPPYIAGLIHNAATTTDSQGHSEVNTAANLAAHALVNVAVALAEGGNSRDALSRASGAVTGEAIGMMAKAYYNKDAKDLTEQERQTVSALATAATGLAGGLVGDSTASAATAAQAGKNAVENNHFGWDEDHEKEKEHEKAHGAADFEPLRPGSHLPGMIDEEGRQHPGSLIPVPINKETGGKNAVVAKNVTNTIIDSNKFQYLFGIDILTEHFKEVVNTNGNIIDTYTKGNQYFEVRESLLFGPSGKATKLETSFEIMPDGTRRFITTIPKEGKK